MNYNEIKQKLWRLGHFWNPVHECCHGVQFSDLSNLAIDSEEVKHALKSFSEMHTLQYVKECERCHNRYPSFDGELGPAMFAVLNEPRCFVSDYEPVGDIKKTGVPEIDQYINKPLAAVGDGNWKRCHGVGDFHACAVRVDMRGIRSHLQPVFTQVLKNSQLAYAQLGLLFHFIDRSTGNNLITGEKWESNYNIEFSFVQASSGWIGLATIGQNQTCQSNIWCRYLASYRPSNVVREWTTLVKHELGHNCGKGHTSGGVMNPSIVGGLPTEWSRNDPSYGWLTSRFGGEPVPDVDPDPDPEPKPDPIDQINGRLNSIEVQLAMHQSLLVDLINKV